MIGFILMGLTLLFILSTPFKQLASVPDEMRMFQGAMQNLSFSLPTAALTSNNPRVVSVDQFDVQPKEKGRAELALRVGGIPVKKVDVNVIPDVKVIPGGQSIGVKMKTAGILVVGHHLVEQNEETQVSPGKKAGVEAGDLILRINGQYVNDLDQVSEMIQKTGENKDPLQLEVLRGSEKMNLSISPVYDEENDRYQIGLYIRDSASGVGTLTFYDPKNKKYGALGHVVSDVDTGKPITVGNGEIVRSKVNTIRKGKSGEPGQKNARFFKEREVLGSITENTPFGVFGKLYKSMDHRLYNDPVPVALASDVKEGPAEILTVVEGQKVEKYDIEIANVVNQRYPATKSMIIRMTDPKLLDKTGGIVQGMSGSPILQDGKWVGAVTHVFVNDPTSGYACFAEWMLRDAGYDLDAAGEEQKAS